MPNGTTAAFAVPAALLRSWLSTVSADAPVAYVIGPEPLSAKMFLDMLGKLNRAEVPSWVYEDAKYCELLLPPHRVRIAAKSPLYGRLPRNMRRGYVEIALEALQGEEPLERARFPRAPPGCNHARRVPTEPGSQRHTRLACSLNPIQNRPLHRPFSSRRRAALHLPGFAPPSSCAACNFRWIISWYAGSRADSAMSSAAVFRLVLRVIRFARENRRRTP
jgi:hypothetical protein